MLSTWHSNQHRRNDFLQTLWREFNISTQAHFYYVGAREVNRKPMLEALVTNYPRTSPCEEPQRSKEQLRLLEGSGGYLTTKAG